MFDDEIPAGYERASNGLLVEKVPQKEQSSNESLDILPEEFDKIQSLDRESLIALCLRMARHCGLIACMTKAQTVQAMLDRLAEIALSRRKTTQERDIMAAMREYLDRVEGRATQRIEQKIQNIQNFEAAELTTAELFAQIKLIADSGLLPSGIAIGKNQTLEITDADFTEIK